MHLFLCRHLVKISLHILYYILLYYIDDETDLLQQACECQCHGWCTVSVWTVGMTVCSYMVEIAEREREREIERDRERERGCLSQHSEFLLCTSLSLCHHMFFFSRQHEWVKNVTYQALNNKVGSLEPRVNGFEIQLYYAGFSWVFRECWPGPLRSPGSPTTHC